MARQVSRNEAITSTHQKFIEKLAVIVEDIEGARKLAMGLGAVRRDLEQVLLILNEAILLGPGAVSLVAMTMTLLGPLILPSERKRKAKRRSRK